MRVWWLLALGVAAAGCGNASDVDADGDRVPASRDCDDHDATAWRRVDLYADADLDGFGQGDASAHCIGAALPPGFTEIGGDCAPDDAARWQTLAYRHRDADGDGWTVDARGTICAGAQLPSGYDSVPGPGQDCDDSDATRWQSLPYGHRDADGDGWTVPEAKSVCSGATLPAGYSTAAGSGTDCDDANATRYRAWAVYADGDGDGFGVGALTTLCATNAVPAGYSALDGDCDDSNAVIFRPLTYAYRDADGDTYTVATGGQLCTNGSLPAGYGNVAKGNDCNDANMSVWRSWNVYADSDGDQVGAGAAVALCATDTMPAGYVASGGDCAPDDNTRWHLLSYAYRDADGDTYTVAKSGSTCSGASLPPGYGNSAKGADCNDGDPAVWVGFSAYVDSDGDGFGVGNPVPQCTDGKVPVGFGLNRGDCAPEDKTRWQMWSYGYVDRDGDTWTVAEPGQVCAGSFLPKPYLPLAHGNDCNDQSTAAWKWSVLYRDLDGDGVGLAPRQVSCGDDSVPAGWSIYGDDPDDGDPSRKTDEELDDLFALIW